MALENFYDTPHISYYDATNGTLKHAVWNGSGWTIQVIDSSGNVGLFTSIAMTDDGQIRISYYDRTNGHLKYALGYIPTSVDYLPMAFK